MSETTQQQTPTPRPRDLDGRDDPDPARRLWSLWRQGQQPRVADFLAQAGVRDPEQIVMALRVDQAERCRLGQWVPAEEYLDAFPAIRDHAPAAIDLIFAEFLLREERGEQPPLEEFLRRFPEHADELKLQIELHREMDDDPAPAGTRATLAVESGSARADGSAACPSIPGYEIVGVLGRGGMGIVYRARQTELKRPVALKMLIAGALASPEAAARFRVEVEAMARLRHPNIVQIYGVGQHAGAPYLVLELVEGRSLAQTLAGTPQPAEWSARTTEALARAIHAAHQLGVVHRDLSPANVLLADDGAPKVTDFGLAKLIIGGGSLRTHTGDLLGTPSYMAPEQAEGSHRAVGAAADIYALGAILYEMLTGRPPFKAEQPLETLRQLISDEPVSPSRLRPRLPRDLETICLKCLHKEPARRYATAEALADDLQRYLEGRPILARRSTAIERSWRWCKRNPVVAGSVGAVGAALLVTTVVAVLYADRQRYFATAQKKANDEITRLADRADEQRRKADEARADAVADSYRALVGETEALRLARPTGWRGTALGNLRRLAGMDTPQRDLVRLRSEAVACLAELDVREVLRLEGNTQVVFGLDFSPDGKTLASADYEGHVCVWELSEGRQLRQITDPRPASAAHWWSNWAPFPFVRFRPGGGYLAYTNWGRRVEFLGWKDQKSALPLRRSAQPRELAFDRKGELLGISWGDGDVGLYEAATGAVRRLVDTRVRAAEGFYMPLALSPDGDLLATRGPGHAVQLYTVATGGEPRVLGRHAALVRSLAFSPDGKRLVSASEDRTAKLWDVHGGKEVLSFQGHTSSLTSVAFSPDGALVATSSDDQTLRLWAARSGQPLQSVHPGGTPVVVAFSPDGHRLAAGCGASASVVVYELAERLGRQLPGYREITMALAVHPRKPLLASATRRYIVSLEDLVTGEELRTWDFAGMLGRLAFSPDGRMLAVAPFADNPTYQWLGNKDVYLVDTENGKKQKLVLGDVSAAVAFDSAGRLLAVGHQSGAVTVCNAESGETVHRWQSTNGWISEVALCRGGQLLVGEVGGSLRLCDMVDGRTIRELRLPRGLFRFVVDPTERQVAAVDLFGTVRILKLPDLQQVGTIDRSDGVGQVGLGFSGDGRWLAIGGADRRVSIYDARTLRRIIQLPTQDGAVYDVAFQRHGSGLAQGGAGEILSFWDLSQIELALAANGLGWEGAPPDGVPGTSQTGPVPRGRLETGWGKRDESIWYLQQVLKTNPDQADLLMELAWLQVMGPTKFRNATKALPLARRAVALAPDEPLCLNTLGVVYYRLGQWKEAADTLQASAQTNPEGPAAYDLFFLAMAYRQTGQPAKAKDCYDQAMRWCRAHGKLAHHQLAELLAIRAEAEGLLGPTSPGALSAGDQDIQKAGKAVRLVWFPRFSPDGKRLITAHGSWDANEGGEVRVWQAETGKPIFVIPTERGVRTVAWAPNGKSFLSGDYGGIIFFYDAETGNQTDQIKLPGNVEVLQYSPDGKRLFAAAGDGSVRVWEVPSKNQVYTWKMLHRGGIWGMALAPDGKMLATAGQDHFARLLDTENFKVLHEFQHPADVNGVVFSKDNKTLLTGCGDAAIRVFDVASSNEVRKLEGHTRNSVTDLDFSPDGKFLASGAMDRTVRIWDLVDFERPKLKSTVGGFNDLVFGVAISPNGRWLAAVGWDDRIKFLDLSTLEEKWTWQR